MGSPSTKSAIAAACRDGMQPPGAEVSRHPESAMTIRVIDDGTGLTPGSWTRRIQHPLEKAR
jgi:hypothetical protein